MPIFEYVHIEPLGRCREMIEVVVLGDAKPLTECPQCDRPVKRIMSPFSHGKNRLSDSNLKDKGFSKFVSEGGGTFRKSV